MQIEKLLRREKGKDASLGVDVRPKKRSNGVAYLTYAAISEIFSFLDADTLLTIHESAVDKTIFDRSEDYEDSNKSKYLALTPDLVTLLSRSIPHEKTNRERKTAAVFEKSTLRCNRY